jgi:hypothetical protein
MAVGRRRQQQRQQKGTGEVPMRTVRGWQHVDDVPLLYGTGVGTRKQETKNKTKLNKNEESESKRTGIDFGHGCEEAIQASSEGCSRAIQSVTVCIDTLQ